MSNLLGISLLSLGDLPAAFEAFRCELELYEELGVDANVASANSNLAETALRLDDRYLAAVHQQASLDLALTIGQPVMLAYSTIVAAQLAAADDEWVLALRLLGAGQAGLHDAGILLYDADQAVVDRLRQQGTGSLGDARAADEVRAGSALGIIEAARLARDVFASVIRRETLDHAGTPHESRIPDERKPT
jgi:hypothetical protein